MLVISWAFFREHTVPFHISAVEWNIKNCLLHVYTFLHMWHPCWISPLPLQHKKTGELWNTGSFALNWKWTWKGHPTAWIIFTTAKKQVKKQEKVSLLCQTFHKITVKTAVRLSPSCFSSDFLPEVLPLMLFLLWSQFGTSGPASFWQDTRTGSTCLLIPSPLVAVPIPLLLFFPFPDLILSLAED